MAEKLPTKPGQQLVPPHRRNVPSTLSRVDPITGRPKLPGELPSSTALPVDPLSAAFGYPVPTYIPDEVISLLHAGAKQNREPGEFIGTLIERGLISEKEAAAAYKHFEQVGTIPAGGIADLPEQKLLELYRGEFPPDTELLRTQHGTPAVFEAEGEEYPEGRLRGPFAQELLGVERTRPGGAMISEGIYSGEEFKVGEEYFKVYGEKALYEMEVPKSLVEGTFLDWDAPINEQPEGMEERMMSFLRGIHPDAVKELHRTTDDPTGAQVFRMGEKYLRDPSDTPYSLAFGDSGFSPKLEATRRLQAQGIPGLRFLDQFSRDPHPSRSYEVSLWGETYDPDDPYNRFYVGRGDTLYEQYAIQRITEEIWERDEKERLAKQQGMTYEEWTPEAAALRPPVERSSSGTDLTSSSKESVIKSAIKHVQYELRNLDTSEKQPVDLKSKNLKEEIAALEAILEDVGALEIKDKPLTRNHVIWDQRLLDQISRSTLTRKKAQGGFIDKPLYERTL